MTDKFIVASLFASFALAGFGANMDSPQKESAEFSLDSFRNPPAFYRSVPFWSWNEDMQPDEVARQVDEIKKAGWGGAFVHSRVGLTTPYMKADWFKAVDATIEACKKNGLIVWLYDEDKFPSGFSGGEVPFADMKFREKILFARKVGDAPSEKTAVAMGEPSGGLQVYSLTKPIGDGWFNGASYVDTMSQKAMRKFIDCAYEPYWKKYSGLYGNVILAEFTDEPTLSRGRQRGVGFSSETVGEFEKMWGYNPISNFGKLFIDGDDGAKFRLQYYRTLDALLERNFFKQIGEWCDSRGISLTGHCLWEWPLLRQHLSSGRVMPYYRYMGIPGVDALCMETIWHAGTVKQCASVANQYGKKRVLSEIYGVCGQGLSFVDRKWLAVSQMSYGVNLINPHLSLYTMAGCRKRDYPQNIYYPQPWWHLNKYLDEPLARLCYLLSRGAPDVDTLVLHPMESIEAVWVSDIDTGNKKYSHSSKAPTPKSAAEIEKISANFDAVILGVSSSQITFDFADEQLLQEDGFVKDGKIGTGKMAYKNVVIPTMRTMRPSTFAFLKEFAAAGGKVLLAGDAPTMLDCEQSSELVEWFGKIERVSPDKIGAALTDSKSVSLSSKSGEGEKFVRAYLRKMPDGTKTVFLSNVGRRETFSGKVFVTGDFTRAEKYDYDSGEIIDVFASAMDGGIEIPVELAPAHALAFKVGKGISPVKKAPVVRTVASVSVDNWDFKRLDDNCLTLDMAKFSFGDNVSKAAVPVIEIQRDLNSKKFDGALSLVYPFKVDGLSKNRKVRVVVEHPEACEIRVNGKLVEYNPKLGFWRDFRWLPIDITGKLRDGDNEISLSYKDFKHGDTTVYDPAWRRYGTEIESIYLVGDFSVRADCEKFKGKPFPSDIEFEPPALLSVHPDSIAVTEPNGIAAGDITKQGLPFYVGRILSTASVGGISVPEAARAVLEIEGNLDVPVAEVIVNGKRAKVIYESPLRVDITDCLDGQLASIEIVQYTTLRNLTGPHHNPEGEPKWCGPEAFDSHCDRETFANWAATGKPPVKNWHTGYCLRPIGELGKISLKMEVAE